MIDRVPGVADEHKMRVLGLAGAAGGLGAAQLSGFGVYLMASTVVGTVSSALGVTLPFVFYTGMSKTISIVIGPAGWAALALWGVFELSSPAMRKTVPAVMLVAAIRRRLEIERLNALEQHRIQEEELANELQGLRNALAEMAGD